MKTRIVLLFWLGFALAGMAQQQGDNAGNPDDHLWTLKECVDYAIANNLQVKRGELGVESGEINLRQARFNMLPSANASGSYGYNWGRGLDPVTNQFVASQRNNVSSLGASGSLLLFNNFRLQNQIKQNAADLSASKYDLAKAKNDVALNVITLFLNVVFNKEQVENANLQLESSKQQLERTRKQVEAGSLAKAEELNLEAQVASNELNLVNQNNALALSMLQLKQALQIPASQEFDVVIPQIDPEDLIIDQTRDEVFAIAHEIMPEVKSSRLKIESTHYGIKAARANLYPRLVMNGSLNTNYSKNSEAQFVSDGGYTLSESPIGYAGSTPVYSIRPTGNVMNTYKFRDQVSDNFYKSVGLTLQIPIFNNYSARAALQRAIIANEQEKINAKAVDNTLRQNIESAFNDALAAAKSYEASLKQVQARDEAYRMTKQRYEIGAANYVDYQIAENNLFQAKSDLARAKYNFIFRKKLLDFYQGKPIEY